MQTSWDTLPPSVRAEVESKAGRVTGWSPAPAGSASDVAGTLETDTGKVFVKAVKLGSRDAWMLRREATVSPYLLGVGAAVHWTVETAEWLTVGFQHVSGRHADLSPGSPDLALVARTLEQLAAVLTPAPSIRGLSLAQRWTGQSFWETLRDKHPERLPVWVAGPLPLLIKAEATAPQLIDGNTLAHTDLTAENILIESASCRVIDWAFPAKAAEWVDTAYMVLRLIQTGHTPAEAEEWARKVATWDGASAHSTLAFNAALTGLWTLRAAENPGSWWDKLSATGLTWLRYQMASVDG